MTMGGGNGPALSLSWPTALPKPTVTGSSVSYADVIPGVDLRMSATTIGGFTQTLIVKTPAAAADPALAQLKLAAHGAGLSLHDDGHGNLRAVTRSGAVAFQAPAPVMWDSSTNAVPTAPANTLGRSAAALSGVSGASVHPAAPVASTANGPGTGAQVARVADTVSGSTILLAPDKHLLTGAGVHFPLYIDPTWTAIWKTGAKQHFVEVQAGCPTAANEDSTTYGDPGVGDNTFSGCVGVERSYFQVGIPSQVHGAQHIVTAYVSLKESYSASCSASSNVNVYAAKSAIGGGTDWNNKPALGNSFGTHSYGPACSSEPSINFTLDSTTQKTLSSASTLTFAVTNGNESSGTYFKRFANNPTISVEYNHYPNAPGSLDAKAGSTDLGCDTASPYPLLGKTDSVTPPTMYTKVTDPDADDMAATFTYWVDGSTTKNTVTSANTSSGLTAQGTMKSGFVSGLADGTVVDWQVTGLTDGEDSVSSSTVCHFTAYPNTPVPTLTPKSVGTTEHTTATFTAKTDAADKALKFVYGLDIAPSTSNPPASQTINVTDGTGAHDITVTPSGPGTHKLYVDAYDAAGNRASTSTQFTVQGAPGQTYSSFQAALNNTSVSPDSTHTAGDFDGSGNTISLTDLRNAGWAPSSGTTGNTVTVDGAQFTLPNFNTSGASDNVLADNQTIQFPANSGPDGNSTGQSLVVLATGTYAEASSAVDSPTPETVPYVPPGTDVVGTDCTLGNNAYQDCSAPSGTVNYTDPTVGSNGSEPYRMLTPDWVYGSSTLASLILPHRNYAAGTQQTTPVGIYAFAIRLEPGKTVSSITLPDVAGPVNGVSGRPLSGMPAMHIFGIAFRDTTTAPGGTQWTGAWASPSESHYKFTGNVDYTNLTVRTAATPSVTGGTVRLRLSNALGTAPVTLNHVTVATQSTGPTPTGAPQDVSFTNVPGGGKSVTIPAGSDVYSDPLTFGATAGHALLISYSLTDATLDGHIYSSATSWITAPATTSAAGDHTADTTATAFTGTGSTTGDFTNVLAGVDVVGSTPGLGTVAVLGDNINTPYATGTKALHGAPHLATGLVAALAAQTTVPDYGVVDLGVPGNRLDTDLSGNPGRAALTRLDRDVLAEPGIQNVVVAQGLNDVLAGESEQQIIQSYNTLSGELSTWGVRTVFTTMTPCYGLAACTTALDATRVDLNSQMMSDWTDVASPYRIMAVDTDAVVAGMDPTSTYEVLSTAGFQALPSAFTSLPDLTVLGPIS
ncbi:SGNH/GDSL hydrolase family protein [Streptacidiphilus rugosus]|uniref:hypothetical protein n=1 Tax=Streptacidiphilus rugosus TaxID=405783 RepID=UPI000B1F0BF0|nr:hypothetical protein [Streptacidiphilus rugosus]